jgi:hypothetical protein
MTDETEITGMVSNLPHWEKEPRRLIYRFLASGWDGSISGDGKRQTIALLDTKLGVTDGWDGDMRLFPKTIRDYYDYMKGEATQDRRMGLNASFALDFIRVIRDGLKS